MIHRNRQFAHILVAAAALSACAALGGCAGPLLSEEDTRSQFDHYDTLRNQHADQYVFDEFGRRRPNLSARLSPRD